MTLFTAPTSEVDGMQNYMMPFCITSESKFGRDVPEAKIGQKNINYSYLSKETLQRPIKTKTNWKCLNVAGGIKNEC